MNTTLNKVIHFQGSETNWKRNISNGIWKDCIVFGLVRNEETYITTKRIYGGRDGWGAEYEYKSTITVASIQDAEYLLTDSNIGLLVNIVNSGNLSENGSYIINYNSNGSYIQVELYNPYYNQYSTYHGTPSVYFEIKKNVE